MSKPQAINDHSFWGGGRNKASVFPEGNKVKQYVSAEGAGEMMRYEDTTEDIKSQQTQGVAKAKARPMKPEYRN
jgi:hypothetical protein